MNLYLEDKIHAINPIYRILKIDKNKKRNKRKKSFSKELSDLENTLEDDEINVVSGKLFYDEIIYHIKEETNVDKLNQELNYFFGRKYYQRLYFYKRVLKITILV